MMTRIRTAWALAALLGLVWATGLARAINEGDHSLYPLLADALDDLGEPDAAGHCRQGEHVKGCHIVDWVLGME
jgi:hypothetical protein